MFDRLKALRTNRRLARELKETNKQLARIAEVLERQFPDTRATTAEQVTVEDVDIKLQRAAEQIEAAFLSKHGRYPTPDEVMAQYDELKHLL